LTWINPQRFSAEAFRIDLDQGVFGGIVYLSDGLGRHEAYVNSAETVVEHAAGVRAPLLGASPSGPELPTGTVEVVPVDFATAKL
jgi:hypothetical protein